MVGQVSNALRFSEINHTTASTSRTSKLIFVKASTSHYQVNWSNHSQHHFRFDCLSYFLHLTLVSTSVLTMFKAVHLLIKIIKMSVLSCATNHRSCEVWSVDYYHNCYSTCSKRWKAAHEHKWILEGTNSSYLFCMVSGLVSATENWVRLWAMIGFGVAGFPETSLTWRAQAPTPGDISCLSIFSFWFVFIQFKAV